jgi:taurine dioxygenase
MALEIRNLVEGVGAEVIGLDPSQDLDDATRALLRRTFDERGALIFRGLDIDKAYQDTLCRMLIGDDGPSPNPDRAPQMVSNKEEGGAAPYGRLMFHADMMWAPEPFQVLSLYALDVHPESATTSVANGVYAWEHLPDALRAQVDTLEATQMSGQVYSRGGDDLIRPQRETDLSTVKPIGWTHPRTGKRVLYVSQQTTREVIGMTDDASEDLLQTLFSELYAENNVYEHRWEKGDLLVLDNVAVQHARGNVDRDGPTRTLRKVIAPIPKMKYEAPKFEKA